MLLLLHDDFRCARWNGPVGCVRIGQIDNEFIVNSTNDEMLDSDLDLIYVGTETEMLMIEGSAEFISDERFYEALEFAQKSIQPIIEAQKELAKIAGKAKKEFPLVITPQEVTDFCEEQAKDKIIEALAFDSYTERKIAIEKSSMQQVKHWMQNLVKVMSIVTTWLVPLMNYKRSFTARIS